MVTVGGELTLDQLELRWDASLGVFRAPPQLKAVGGVFLVDDFGRQQVRPRDLLNRWMIPLDRGIDHLSLPNGQVVQVPFDCLVIFATNLDPRDLVEEAFFRRIRHKVRVDNPTPSQYREIFRQACLRKNVPYDEGAVHFIEEHYYEGRGIEPRACHPGDLVSDLCDLADYMGLRPTLDRLLLQPTCESYFGADLTDRPGGGGASNGI
jgi:SpoVK/Ycf46/Vps4 family AAA+-type ATPase